MAETHGLILTRTAPGVLRLRVGEQVAELPDSALTDAAHAITAGTTPPPDMDATGLDADRPWLAGLARASDEDRMALLRTVDKFNLSVVLLYMQADTAFVAAFQDSLSARAWHVLREDATRLASGTLRSATVRQAIESVRQACLDLEAKGHFRRFRLFRSSRFGAPRPILEDSRPPFPARHGDACFDPLPDGRCRVSAGGSGVVMTLAQALRLRTMAAHLDALDRGAGAFQRAWIMGALALLAVLPPGAIREWLARLDPRTAAAAAALSPDDALMTAFTSHLSPMAADVMTRRAAMLRDAAWPDAALGAAEEALDIAWRMEAEELPSSGPGSHLPAPPFLSPETRRGKDP